MDTLMKVPPSYRPTKLRSLPLREQPAYRVSANAAGCSLVELLAAVIGGAQQIEVAESLLARFGGDIQRIHKAHVSELAQAAGVGQQTAVRLKAALALGLKLHEPTAERPLVNSPADAAALIQYEMSLLEQEILKVILLDNRNHVIDIVDVYRGSVNSSQVRMAEVFKPAVQRMAPAIIVSHNHPTGDPTPSPDDISVTRAMVQAGKILDIECLDHIVVGGSRFVSLKERGLGFS
ncbi:MAG: DNA repair protein RadC [Anaerolineales bacterium]